MPFKDVSNACHVSWEGIRINVIGYWKTRDIIEILTYDTKHYAACLIGILLMVYNNHHIAG